MTLVPLGLYGLVPELFKLYLADTNPSDLLKTVLRYR